MFRQSRNEHARKAGEAAFATAPSMNQSKKKQQCFGKAETSTPAKRAKRRSPQRRQ
jgi:hypothetical protein